jgi:septum formation protein
VRLILASASPRRADLLRAAGYTFETMAVDVDERPRNGEAPTAYVRRLAAEKAQAAERAVRTASARMRGLDQAFGRVEEDVVVLAADTSVVVDGDILGKPADDRDADRMLQLLSGRDHEVLTGISVRGGERELSRVISSVVRIRALSDAERAWYVASGEWRDKAGGYAIQGLASRFIPYIQGSYANVVGLPVAAVDELLRQLRSASDAEPCI